MKHIILTICTAALLLCACNNEKKEGNSSETSSSTKAKEEVAIPGDTTVKYPVAGEFHKMLARSNGTWIGNGSLWFSPDAPPIDAGTSILTNTMAMDGLYQVSAIKGNPGNSRLPWTGVRITGYDAAKKIVTRAMITDGEDPGGVAMKGIWDEASRSMTFPFKKPDASTGKDRDLKEVYTLVDENTETLDIYGFDEKTKKEFKVLHVEWKRKE